MPPCRVFQQQQIGIKVLPSRVIIKLVVAAIPAKFFNEEVLEIKIF